MKVVNLRFFKKISKIKKKNGKKLRKKNRKFTTLDFSHVETVRFSLELLESAATTNLQTFAKIFFSKMYSAIVKRAISKIGFFKIFTYFCFQMATKWRQNGDFYVKIAIFYVKKHKI